MGKRTVVTIGLVLLLLNSVSAERTVSILYPRDRSVVGNRVNLVLDPADIDFFQVVVNKTAYPVVSTAQGAHALQGLSLVPGQNTITVSLLAPPDPKDPAKQTVIASRSIKVFCKEGAFGPVPPAFVRDPFHTREHESACSGCHRLEVEAQDRAAKKKDDVLCSVCHAKIPQDEHVHGPAALWNCLSCHDPELYPAKYSFSAVDPWKVRKSTQSVEPFVMTIPVSALFKPEVAVLTSKPKTKELMAEVFTYLKQNSGDKMLLEVHSDNTPLKTPKPQKQQKSKKVKLPKGFKDNTALTAARAKALAAFLKEEGVNVKRIRAVGLGEKLPKMPNTTEEGRERNNRVEIVIYPADVKVENSQKLPVLTDRDRVVVNLEYTKGSPIKNLSVLEHIPSGLQYIKGTSLLNGKGREPRASGGSLHWDLGDRDGTFTDSLSYVVRKTKEDIAVPEEITVNYRAFDRDQSRIFDPKKPQQRSLTIVETCLKCHAEVLEGKYKHGPVDSGNCTLCHDPHASKHDAWLRKPVWQLCTTCHPEQGEGTHVLRGLSNPKKKSKKSKIVAPPSHPTRRKKDPSQPGKQLSCTGCHDPHGAEHPFLFKYEIKNGYDLCVVCHKK